MTDLPPKYDNLPNHPLKSPENYSPQGGHLPHGGYPLQSEYPPQGGYPQHGGYPPQVGYPSQSGYPLIIGNNPTQGGYPMDNPGFQQQGYYQPPSNSGLNQQGNYPTINSGGIQNTSVILGQPSIVRVGGQPVFTCAIVLSCLVCWCCGWMFGSIAFILAMIGQKSSQNGDHASARSLLTASYGVSLVGVIVGIICIIVIAVLVFKNRKCYINLREIGCY